MFIQKMTRSECLCALTGARLGRLACAQGDKPYAVPFYFVYHDPYLYGFTTPGQKTEWMRANPHVCVELDEVDDAEQWMSIILFGRYEELPDAPEWEEERLRAHQLLQQHPVWWEPGCASSAQRIPSRPVTPIFFRIGIDRITGRRAMPSDGREVSSRMPSPARDSAGWLRRVIDALCRPFAARRSRERYGPSLDEGHRDRAGNVFSFPRVSKAMKERVMAETQLTLTAGGAPVPDGAAGAGAEGRARRGAPDAHPHLPRAHPPPGGADRQPADQARAPARVAESVPATLPVRRPGVGAGQRAVGAVPVAALAYIS
jgi:nitroimidazol reductase NimA-like FMN-containing flavoprotein (pyridoxamine 5'-phosphate oxidase superfamily)